MAEAADGLEALASAAQYHPDVILMDLLLPNMGGLETISHLRERHPDIKVMVLSSLEDETHILTAVQAGALGYFPKSAPRDYHSARFVRLLVAFPTCRQTSPKSCSRDCAR
ncbi:MAG: response regulator transcription factor [Chloroflexi bacterium]|nr:response regulator transcription factor [Chloroflexota bacterium]